jgi:hypothetical protein
MLHVEVMPGFTTYILPQYASSISVDGTQCLLAVPMAAPNFSD